MLLITQNCSEQEELQADLLPGNLSKIKNAIN